MPAPSSAPQEFAPPPVATTPTDAVDRALAAITDR
jgi:hypothetical protein